MTGPTLTATLAARGLTHRPAHSPKPGARVVLRRDAVVFCGTAAECWAWLRGQGPQLPLFGVAP